MPVTDAYATVAKYKSVFPEKTSATNDAEILLQLTAVSRVIDNKLERFFTKDAAPVIRIYEPYRDAISDPIFDQGGALLLETDDMSAAPTLVRVDQNHDGTFEKTVAVTDYELLPRNAPRGPEPRPYEQIRLLTGAVNSTWDETSLVEITCAWGWPAVPEAIAQATVQLTAILRLETPRATTQISAGIDAVLGTSRAARDIVEELQRAYGHAWMYA